MKTAYTKYIYLNKLEDMKEKINSTKRILNICYSKKNLNYNDILKLSQYLDIIINRYYKLIKDQEKINKISEDNVMFDHKLIS